ncbi:MAG: hypothetical protein MjAS7_2132 [Metallosphaera javensis (ex Sakai et al. 2022)]|nr:MAG: hypothetical protein MjAS7_2132 [Metallosphaera javensis (ex Sakai et al. 2022)]
MFREEIEMWTSVTQVPFSDARAPEILAPVSHGEHDVHSLAGEHESREDPSVKRLRVPSEVRISFTTFTPSFSSSLALLHSSAGFVYFFPQYFLIHMKTVPRGT